MLRSYSPSLNATTHQSTNLLHGTQASSFMLWSEILFPAFRSEEDEEIAAANDANSIKATLHQILT